MSDAIIQRQEHQAAHEVDGVMEGLLAVLRPLLRDGERLIWREPFRWHNDEGLISNGYDGFEAESIANMLGCEVVWSFRHVAAIQTITPESQASQESD